MLTLEYFADIELLPDPEFPTHLLLSSLYTKLHRELAPSNKIGIAVCFPGHQLHPPTLGTRMRLLGSRPALQSLSDTDWLTGMHDYIKVSALAEVPIDAPHRTLRRVQVKSNPERLRRRLMKRHGLDKMQARERIPDSVAETLNLPFIQLQSHSTGQTFRLFLSLDPGQSSPTQGEFNAYGLSQNATVPWF